MRVTRKLLPAIHGLLFVLCLCPAVCTGQMIVAHRGASADAPENTLAAFRLAWQQGADAVEGDFYLTKDRQIVCIHDKTTKRTAPRQRNYTVADSTLAQLRSLDVGTWKGQTFRGELIPTLEEVLSVVPADKRIFIEIKCGPEILPHLKKELEQSSLQPEQIVIICFDQAVVRAARKVLPRYRVNWLTSFKQGTLSRKWTPTADDIRATLKRLGANGVSVNATKGALNETLASAIKNDGFELHTWTVNEAKLAAHCASLGTYSITTDKPREIRKAITSAMRDDAPFSIDRTVMTQGYDGERCWVHARPGVIPNQGKGSPTVVMTTQALEISGSDVFRALHCAVTGDLGETWSPLAIQTEFKRWTIDDRTDETICDFVPAWHRSTGTLLGTGQSVRYRDNRVMKIRPRFTGYSVFDVGSQTWSKPKALKMPDEPRFQNCGAGSVQRFDLEDGSILLPVYFKEPKAQQYSVTVCQCQFDGKDLKYLRHGNEMTIPIARGLYEPSLTKFGDRFFLTLRNDEHGYVTSSSDGLHFETPQTWTFDDGEDLGNYNTQQHWVSHPQGLFLVYTRRGAQNDHVFRHRAPLFIAEVDPDQMRVLRSTEQVLIPERGARLGNFGVAHVSDKETWIVTTEWMQSWKHRGRIIPVENPYGADNSIHIAKLKWK